MSTTIIKQRKSALIKARCEPELADQYKRAAYACGLDASDLIRQALREYLPKIKTPCPTMI